MAGGGGTRIIQKTNHISVVNICKAVKSALKPNSSRGRRPISLPFCIFFPQRIAFNLSPYFRRDMQPADENPLSEELSSRRLIERAGALERTVTELQVTIKSCPRAQTNKFFLWDDCSCRLNVCICSGRTEMSKWSAARSSMPRTRKRGAFKKKGAGSSLCSQRHPLILHAAPLTN